LPGLIVFLLIVLPALAFLAWFALDEAFVRIEPGKLGLVLIRGRATDKALLPGPHIVPMFRRMMVQEYPSNELSYRTGDPSLPEGEASALEYDGPPFYAVLGDRTKLRLGYTVRFQLDPAQLRHVHDRFGPDGLWGNARDKSAQALRAALSDPGCGVPHLFGDSARAMEVTLGEAVRDALAADGFTVTFFSIGEVDLGRTGEVIQAIARAQLELEREEAEAATRVAQARIDSELQPYFQNATNDFALRYREVDVWRDVVNTPGERNLAMPAPTSGMPREVATPEAAAATPAGPASAPTPAPPAPGPS
jgi:hypothetical protein